MDLLLAIVLIVLAFLGGALGGMYLVRKQIEKEFADNPRLNAEAVRTLLSANGQKPTSEAKVQQVYHQIIRQQKAALANNKKKK
ncbi:YneF family protein [Streptococcus bouchesdurhonensis]|uniref:YneF family protein n=1 Tax=Streptococcus bouchesdurhonensis TaxID=2954240 RepID=UPI0021C4C2D6|nr:YneF family protein [Streptococcus bouchesdurhonensis]